jgi:RNA polymerase sigma factor (sigma-70 family)
MANITEEILEEILKESDKLLWNIAKTTYIPGYTPEDLMQEMRIKIWQIIKDNQYNPEMCKETSYFYRVCKRHLIDLNKSKIYKYNSTLPQDREYRDGLDQKSLLSEENCTKKAEYPLNFVQNLSENFKNNFF